MAFRRRDVLAALGGVAGASLLAAPAVVAQQGDQVKRLGILRGTSEADTNLAATNAVLLQELARLGWTEGRNLRVDYRLTGSNDPDAVRPHAEGLVRSAPDVIFASPAPAVQALQRLTRTIPVVFSQSGDPVQAGTVQSLTRPGGNITGFISFESSINTKYLQLLKDLAQQVTRVAVLQTRASAWRGDAAVVESVARSFGVTAVVSMVVRDDAAEIERAITAFAQEPNGGVIVPPDNVTARHRALIVALAARHRLPAVYNNRPYVEAGGLMYYSAKLVDYRVIASYVDRILRGANPGDLPVQTPTKFELAINLKTATGLGLTIPPSLFALADEVIE